MDRNRLFVLMLIIVMIFSACSSASEAGGQPEAAETAQPEPTPAGSPVSILVPQAEAVCDRASEAPMTGGYLRGPVAALLSRRENPGEWDLFTSRTGPGYAVHAEEVQTLLCITEDVTASSTFEYTDGSEAFIVDWEILALSWPEGHLLGRLRLSGGILAVKTGDGPGIGPAPETELDRYVALAGSDPILLSGGDCTAISADGSRLISIEIWPERIVRFWDLDTGVILWTQTGAPDFGLCRAGLSPDGELAAVSDSLKTTFVNTATGELLATFETDEYAFLPDGTSILLSNIATKGIVSFELQEADPVTGEILAKYPEAHFNLIQGLLVPADGKSVYSFSNDGALYKWDRETRSIAVEHTLDFGFKKSAALSSDETLIAMSGTDNPITIWSTETGEQVEVTRQTSGFDAALSFVPGQHVLVYSGSDETTTALYRMDVDTGETSTLSIQPGGVSNFVILPESGTLALVDSFGVFTRVPFEP